MIRKSGSRAPVPAKKPESAPRPSRPSKAVSPLVYWMSWLAAALMVFWLGSVVVTRTGTARASGLETLATTISQPGPLSGPPADMPELAGPPLPESIVRTALLDTQIPERPLTAPQYYTVEAGDSVFGIAVHFKLKPETVLWANYNLLNDNPNMLSVGQDLTIPAVDGVLVTAKRGDTVQKLAAKYKSTIDDIISWPGNKLDILDPQIIPGSTVMIPNGEREMMVWVVPTIWRANSGANKSIASGCDTSGVMAMGTGSFMWPTDSRRISGNDFWSGHLGLDIGAATGAPIYASDSGVVVYSGPIGGGYGLMVMIDHGNGFHTLYAHNSSLVARCGQAVTKGQVIAYAGSTGNSTGSHLHFEIRYGGSFMNPHDFIY